MSNKKISALLFLITISAAGLHFQCNKRFDCRESIYSFAIAIKAYPDKDSINIGDTIWLEINEPTTLNDIQTGRMIDYSGAANLGTAIGIAELISANTTNTAGNTFFKFFIADGKEILRSDTNKFREYSFIEISNRYEFKLGLIPQKKGVYKMFISNASNVFRTTNKCTKAGFGITFKDTDQHFYLNEVSFPGIILSGKNGVYFFKVK
jgi:hypothetical protein